MVESSTQTAFLTQDSLQARLESQSLANLGSNFIFSDPFVCEIVLSFALDACQLGGPGGLAVYIDTLLGLASPSVHLGVRIFPNALP
jgi:hypothetical protein